MGPPSYMLSFVDRNVVMRRIPEFYPDLFWSKHLGHRDTWAPWSESDVDLYIYKKSHTVTIIQHSGTS